MDLIDTHAHLQFEKFDSDREEVVKRNSKKLSAIVNPSTDLDSSEKSVELAQSIPNFYSAVGVHPHHVDHWNETYLPKLEKLSKADKVVAVGEIGLDKYLYHGYPQPSVGKQREILIPQIEMARYYKKPILFHCREAYDELYEILKDFLPLKGLIHCFMGDKDVAKKFLNLGLLISFAGNLTYKSNGHMRETAKFVPNDLLLIETDSPYLSPEPLRGQRNEPVNVLYVAQTLAQLKNVSLETVAHFTSTNAKRLFTL